MIKKLFSIFQKDKKTIKQERVLCCPKCWRPFSKWFEWGGKMYCYPCYGFDESKERITEDDGIWLRKPNNKN